MTPITNLAVGDIVRLDPLLCRNMAFAGCLATVDEPKTFGAQLEILIPGNDRSDAPGKTYYRAEWAEMQSTGGKVLCP